MKALFCTIPPPPDIQKGIGLWEYFQASSACPFYKSSTETKESVEHCWNDTDRG